MASSVRSRPNHYEVLGLPATASEEEIKRAFAKAMGMFGARRVATAADIGLAFEVLRDPAKRQAYDRDLGLVPEQKPTRWTIAVPERSKTGFISWGSTATAHRAAPDSAPPPFAEVEPQHEPELRRELEPPAEPGLASILASLRELSKEQSREPVAEFRQSPEQLPQAEQAPDPQPEPRRVPKPEPQVEQLLAMHWAEEENTKTGPVIDWKWAAVGVGGLLVTAGLVGALGGLSVKDAEQSQWARPAVTVPLPTAMPESSTAVAAPPKALDRIEFRPARPVHDVAKTGTTREISPKQPAPSIQPQVGQSQSIASADQSAPVVEASDPLAVEAPAAQPVAANLPLPNSVIARTIDRIGYSCGAVASTAAVEGAAPGIFKVTCSSGQSYQAAPVRGRYRFRRLAH